MANKVPVFWHVLRVVIYLVNKLLAIYLILNVDGLAKLYVFLISSVFDLFIVGELNIKPMTASARVEIKK